MSNTISCPGCNAEYDATGYDPGDQFQCPGCQEIVTVPGGAPAAPAAKAAKTPSRGGNTTRRHASRGPAPVRAGSAKMRVVNEAVGMGALDPSLDPRAIRRGMAPAQPVQQGGDKTVMIVGAVVAAIMILGAVIYIAKQPSADEKKAAAAKKKAEQEARERADAAAKAGSSSGTSDPSAADPNKPRVMDVPGSNAEIASKVSEVLSLVKGMPQDSTFFKVSAQLLKYGSPAVGQLIEHFNSNDQATALAARAIVSRMTKWNIPEEPFADQASRERIKGDVFATWMDKAQKGSLTIVSEAEYLGGGGVAENPPPNIPPANPGGDPPKGPGMNEMKKPGGGTSEAAMRRDLPQHLSNYARGTQDQREQTVSEIRKYGKPVIGALIAALKEEDPAICNAANDLLERFTNQRHGRPPGEPGDRGPFIQKWEEWWKGAEAGFSM